MKKLQELEQRIKNQWIDTTREQNIKDWAFIGLIGEIGEIASCLKKHNFLNQILDKENLKEECGDVLHYLIAFLYSYGLSLEEISSNNINKLNKRYPNGFNIADAILKQDKNDNI